MHLLSALAVASIDDIDPLRPLAVGDRQFGLEATAEAIRILQGGDFPTEINIQPHHFVRPTYWLVNHQVEGEGEIFGFSAEDPTAWPTALEIAVVRALAAATPDQHAQILAGSQCISLGPEGALKSFRKVALVVALPLVDISILSGGYNGVAVKDQSSEDLTQIVLDCLGNSFKTSPLKFRYLEIYRMMEARFLADVKSKLFASFDAEPSAALSEAADALKSEMAQISSLATDHPEPFEECWNILNGMKNTNRFVAALFKRIEKKGLHSGGKCKSGAALIYQIRCSIVHAGEKDMIFEKYPDGESALSAVICGVERAALRLVGMELT